MKRLAMFSLVVCIGAALPVCAQHGGGGHGGGFGHSASAFHGSASSGFRSAPSRPGISRPNMSSPGMPYSGGMRYPANRPAYAPRYSSAGAPVYPYAYSARRAMPNSGRAPYGGNQSYRQPYRGQYDRGRHRIVYGGAYLGWPAPYYLSDPYLDSYPYDDSYDNSLDGGYYGDQTTPPYAAYNDPGYNSGYGPGYNPGYDSGYDSAPYRAPDSSVNRSNFGPEYAPTYRPNYPPASPNSRPASPAPAQPTITLVFKDGRPPEHIRNYLLSRDSITIWDGSAGELPREIRIDQLNVAATEKANGDTGVDFYLPRTFQ